MTMQATVGAKVHLGLKAKSASTGKRFLKQKQGDSFSATRGKWMHLLQIVDRRNNRYRKVISDLETGEVIRDVDEPLTDHQSYGDARRPSS